MIELERQGKKRGAEGDEEGREGHLPPVKLHDPHPQEVTGWSPSEWRNAENSDHEGEE